MLNKNTIYKKKSELDQFYTSDKAAKFCYSEILKFVRGVDEDEFDLFLEPTAGKGTFLMLMPENKRYGLDLEPKHAEIIKGNFMEFQPPPNCKKIIAIGNPPFGKNANLAIKIFNKAAEFSEYICFIVPKSFKKQSVWNKLDLNFHLICDLDLPKKSFILNDEPYDVPCCFQIWEKRDESRKVISFKNDEQYLSFVKKDDADFAVRRVGGRAGRATKNNIEGLSDSSHYFIKVMSKDLLVDEIVELINTIDYKPIASATAGVRSLSKPEFFQKFLETLNADK